MSELSPAENISRYVRLVASRLWLGNLLYGTAGAAGLIALLFWLTLGVDYAADRWMEAGLIPRVAISIVWGCVVLFVLWRWVIRSGLARPSDRSIALWMESRQSNLEDQLLTAIELNQPPEGTSPTLINESARRAWEIIRPLDYRQFIPLQKLRSIGTLALIVVSSTILFAVFAPAMASAWSQRVIMLANVTYPRWTRLSLTSMEGEVTKIPKGRDFTVVVDIDPSSYMPPRADIVLRPEPGTRIDQQPMTRQGPNRFRFVVQRPMAPVRFRVNVGDARSAWYRLELVDSPLITRANLVVMPPAYTGLGEQQIPLAGSPVPVPTGSDVTISLTSSKKLKSAFLSESDASVAMTKIGETEFESRIKIDRPRKFLVQVIDQDGLPLAEDFMIELNASPDKPPEISASFHGVSSGITRQARIPIRIKGEDDFGIARTEFDISISGKTSRQLVPSISNDAATVDEEILFELHPFHLDTGTKLSLQIVGTDHLEQAGSSEQFDFEIITPEELMSRMGAQEVNLRERFEQVVSELREAQRAIAEMDESSKEGAARRLACDRAMAIVRKGSGETESIAEGFANIIEEFTNNQMANSDIVERLGNGIRLPMNRLCENTFPRALVDLEKLASISETNDYMTPRDASLLSLNDVLFQCEQILRGMSKLESFNELVSNLKGIIEEEQKLRDNIQKVRREKALDLLKD
ncbi:hypothetical protein K2Y11_03165 [bacterium]|nr:hypothetical protein [bacterium]